ncbi:GDSL esterase/lipase At4g16230 isoform X4 [Gossypium hirsutum]|uniref:GDSL esterase/lipase At4g16230 isoform X4 n=1 Tax=Gossypium hirsutum TaxID=3635 RepID=A0ABM3AR78_GOSHI|nr:GDSL esterase/lipase At4g16230-like isoform X4 [Gossypium hirsutum]
MISQSPTLIWIKWLNMFLVPRVMFRISASLIFFLFNIMSAEKIPTIFIFGDSIVDVGNNNYINTLAKAMFPNGIDFCKNCLSGRFTNGRTVIDILEQRLGAKDFRPPYLAPNTTGDVVLRGVNYASSGSGILNDTGLIWGGRISLDEQISNFKETKARIVSIIGRRETKRLLKHQSLFIVVTGSNDFFLGKEMISDGSFLSSKFESQLRIFMQCLKISSRIIDLTDLKTRTMHVVTKSEFMGVYSHAFHYPKFVQIEPNMYFGMHSI